MTGFGAADFASDTYHCHRYDVADLGSQSNCRDIIRRAESLLIMNLAHVLVYKDPLFERLNIVLLDVALF